MPAGHRTPARISLCARRGSQCGRSSPRLRRGKTARPGLGWRALSHRITAQMGTRGGEGGGSSTDPTTHNRLRRLARRRGRRADTRQSRAAERPPTHPAHSHPFPSPQHPFPSPPPLWLGQGPAGRPASTAAVGGAACSLRIQGDALESSRGSAV